MPPEVRAATERWIERVVVGQSFCPFAARPYAEDDVLIERLPPEREDALHVVYRRGSQMAERALPETTLLVADVGLADFDDFLAFQRLAEHLLEDNFPSAYVTAGFHPAYRFAEYPEASAVHHIHRSPFPVLQLLRRTSVAFAKTRRDVRDVLARNRERAEELGAGWFGGQRRGAAA